MRSFSKLPTKMSAYEREHLDHVAQQRITLVEKVESSTSRNLATALIPLLCGTFVYEDMTSIMTKKAPFGKGSIFSCLLIKSVVSLIYDFNFCTIG